MRKQGNNQIVVQLAGVFNQQRAVSIIGSTAALELYKLEDDLVAPSINPLSQQPVAHTNLYSLLAPVSSSAGDKGAAYYLFNPKKKLVAGPAPTKAGLLSTRTAKCLTGERTGAGVQQAPRRRRQGDVKDGGRACRRAGRSSAAPRRRRSSPATTAAASARACRPRRSRGSTYYYLFKYHPDNARRARSRR